MFVEFITDIDSPSGYSNFARVFIRAAVEQGIQCKVTRSKHDRTTIPLCEWWSKNIVNLLNADGKPDIRMHIETPEFFRVSKRCKSLGFTFWETNLIPSEPPKGEPAWPAPQYNWAKQMNYMDGMWTSANFAIHSFQNAGVTVPCHVVGIPVEVPEENYSSAPIQELAIRGVTVDMGDRPIPRDRRPIVIASIAQWTWRKNLEDTIAAVCTEFTSDEVVLLLKTYGAAQNHAEEEEKIRQRTRNIKAMLGLKNLPRVILLQNTLSDAHMERLYNSIDIFLSTSRGEGFCIPTAQAMAHGVPTVATGWSAFVDYIIPDETGWLVDYHMEPVMGMPHIPWYRPNQQWARVDMNDLMAKLREVYAGLRGNDRSRVMTIAQQGKEFIRDNFSREAIGKRTIKLFEESLS